MTGSSISTKILIAQFKSYCYRCQNINCVFKARCYSNISLFVLNSYSNLSYSWYRSFLWFMTDSNVLTKCNLVAISLTAISAHIYLTLWRFDVILWIVFSLFFTLSMCLLKFSIFFLFHGLMPPFCLSSGFKAKVNLTKLVMSLSVFEVLFVF